MVSGVGYNYRPDLNNCDLDFISASARTSESVQVVERTKNADSRGIAKNDPNLYKMPAKPASIA